MGDTSCGYTLQSGVLCTSGKRLLPAGLLAAVRCRRHRGNRYPKTSLLFMLEQLCGAAEAGGLHPVLPAEPTKHEQQIQQAPYQEHSN